jgi:hypothetical protein
MILIKKSKNKKGRHYVKKSILNLLFHLTLSVQNEKDLSIRDLSNNYNTKVE